MYNPLMQSSFLFRLPSIPNFSIQLYYNISVVITQNQKKSCIKYLVSSGSVKALQLEIAHAHATVLIFNFFFILFKTLQTWKYRHTRQVVVNKGKYVTLRKLKINCKCERGGLYNIRKWIVIHLRQVNFFFLLCYSKKKKKIMERVDYILTLSSNTCSETSRLRLQHNWRINCVCMEIMSIKTDDNLGNKMGVFLEVIFNRCDMKFYRTKV